VLTPYEARSKEEASLETTAQTMVIKNQAFSDRITNTSSIIE
jgi:hypothetical protein